MVDPDLERENPPSISAGSPVSAGRPPGHFGSLATGETHVSWLVFSEDRVFKIKKPLTLGFLDWTDGSAREQACRNEVELNRRLAPSVYLGVGHFEDPSGGREPVVVMRRMPADRSLSALIERGDGDLEGAVADVAARLASFHATAPSGGRVRRAGSVSAVRRLWSKNLRELRTWAVPEGGRSHLDALDAAARRYLKSRRPLFNDRIRRGRVVDGHGDLLCDDIFLTAEGPQILDCLEFDDRLRYGDVVSDLAFLAMDLEHRSRPDLAASLVARYQAQSGDHWPPSLTHFWVAYRALVRAKVTYLRSSQSPPSARAALVADADGLVGMAARHLSRALPKVVVVGGLPGTGKSTLAQGLSQVTGWPVVSSDHLRRLPAAGDAGTDRLYSTEQVDANYGRLVAAARELVGMGESVVLDATWSRSARRRDVAAMAAATGADLVALRCVAAASVAAQRMVDRQRAARSGRVEVESDATPEVAEAMRSAWDDWPEAAEVDTTDGRSSALESALTALRWTTA